MLVSRRHFSVSEQSTAAASASDNIFQQADYYVSEQAAGLQDGISNKLTYASKELPYVCSLIHLT